eukprot:108373-Amorphochlora_amoeboformis.AAC.1
MIFGIFWRSCTPRTSSGDTGDVEEIFGDHQEILEIVRTFQRSSGDSQYPLRILVVLQDLETRLPGDSLAES